MSKTKLLKYETLGTQEYILKLPAYLATFLLKIRSKTLPCRINHSSSHSRGDSHCRLCKLAEESQEHAINCSAVSGDDEWLTLQEYMSPQRFVDEVRLRKVFSRFKKFVDLVENAEWIRNYSPFILISSKPKWLQSVGKVGILLLASTIPILTSLCTCAG